MADIPDELIKLERSAEEERKKLAGLDGEQRDAQWRAWREAAAAFHSALAEYVARDDVAVARYDLEMAVKKAVRHPEEAVAT